MEESFWEMKMGDALMLVSTVSLRRGDYSQKMERGLFSHSLEKYLNPRIMKIHFTLTFYFITTSH